MVYPDWLGIAIVAVPIGLIGFIRWGSWLIRKIVGFFYVAEPARGHTGRVSIVTPVYQEDPRIFEVALDSWVASKPHEIIAVIDEADQACARLFAGKASQTQGVSLRLITTAVPGKRPALAQGVLAAEGELVALVDSDTIWEPDCLPKLTSPFAYPEVGGVTCRQRVYLPTTLSQKLTSLIFELRYADEMRFLGKMDQGFSCLSGRTALYRRDAILPYLDDLVNETFWGRQCISGDDKRLTYLLQAQGYKTRFQ